MKTTQIARRLGLDGNPLRRRGRWVLDRRRLAGWEAAWDAVGPQWTKRFRSRG